MPGRALVREYNEIAAERILDVAARLFVERGVAGVGMAEVAKAAGCSRATLYRYFDSREALRVAYIHREARRIERELAAYAATIRDPAERVVEAVLETIRRVRRDPALAGWFAPDDVGIASVLAQSSEVIEGMVAAFLGDRGAPDTIRRARWLLRVVLSLLAMPGANEREERAMIQEFVVPVVVPPSAAARRKAR
jgi:AcrR family transcriptional regulator